MNIASILPLNRELCLIQVHQMTSGRFHAVGMGVEADSIERLVELCDAIWTAPEQPDDDGRHYAMLYAHACGYAD